MKPFMIRVGNAFMIVMKLVDLLRVITVFVLEALMLSTYINVDCDAVGASQIYSIERFSNYSGFSKRNDVG